MNRPVNRPVAAYLGGTALAATAALATAYAPLCWAQEDSRPLYQVEVIAFAYNDANPGEEAFPRQTPAEAASDLIVQSAPLEQFDFDSALDIGTTLDTVPPGADQDAAIGANGSGADGTTRDVLPGAETANGVPPGTEAQGLDALAPVSPEPLIGPSGFRLLGPESYKLGAAYAKLERLEAYRPLLHAAWIEPALSEDQAKTISTADLGALNPEGSLEFYASRYLHVTVDLRYRPTAEERAELSGGDPFGTDSVATGPNSGTGAPARAGAAADPATAQGGGSFPSSSGAAGSDPRRGPITGSQSPGTQVSSPTGAYYGTALDEISLGPSLTMKASRRIAAGELQYFDHPYFGLLVLVTPYDPQTQQQDGVAPVP